MKALASPSPDHWREIEVPARKVRYVDEQVDVDVPLSIWSGFWSFLGAVPEKKTIARRKEVWETVVEKKKVPDNELNEYFAPKLKPPDYTEALAISPLSVSINSYWAGMEFKSTVLIISPTSCFEIWLDLGGSCFTSESIITLCYLVH
jgi:hypothetical protein